MKTISKKSTWVICLAVIIILCITINFVLSYIVHTVKSGSTLDEVVNKSINGNIIGEQVLDDVAYIVAVKDAKIIENCFYNKGERWYSTDKNFFLKSTSLADIIGSKVADKFIIRIIQFHMDDTYTVATDSLQSTFNIIQFSIEGISKVTIQSVILKDLPKDYKIELGGESIFVK